MRLKDRVAIVTGGGSGLGAGIAKRFAEEGASLVLADINGDNAETVAEEIRKGQTKAIAHQLDVTDYDAAGALVARTVEEFGTVDILVNSAGTSKHMTFLDAEPSEFKQIMAVNLEGTMYCGQHAGRVMVDKGYGRIVNIASTEGLGATPETSPYTSAKHGVIGLTRSMAVELGREGITVNCICPGAIRTGMTAGIKEEHKQIFARRRVPLARYAEPEEVAHGTLSLVLPASSYMNGIALPMDAGLTIKNA